MPTPLFRRKALMLAKRESVAGTDATPESPSTANPNLLLVSNLNVVPQDARLVDRELLQAYFGGFEQIPAATFGRMEFEVEAQGSGTAGTPAEWGDLVRACGFSETALATAHANTAAAGAVGSITLHNTASAVDNAYKGMRIRTTGGTGSGQTRVCRAYNGTTKVFTPTVNFSPAPDATTTYSIDAQVIYMPVSASFDSLTLVCNMDGVQHKLLMARGNLVVTVNALGLPKLRFNFTGLYVPVTDASAPAGPIDGWKKPLAVNNTNTSGFAIHGYAGVLEQLSIDMGNQVEPRSLVGAESVLITNRTVSGQITMEATTVANFDIWTKARAATTGPLTITHGVAAGSKFHLDGSDVQIQPPSYTDSQGVAMWQAGLRAVPYAGNDEIILAAA